MHRIMYVGGFCWLAMSLFAISDGNELASFCYTITANIWFVGGIVIKVLRP